MDTAEVLSKIGESLRSSATVRSVFGEPIQVEGKTIVPVAKVAYGFGAGGGQEIAHQGTGGGGGGGVRVSPVGVLEITPVRTRFLRYADSRLPMAAFVAGVLLGRLLLRRKT